MARTRRTRPSHRVLARRRWQLAPLRMVVAIALASATLPFVTASPAAAAVPTTIAIDGNQDGATTDWQGLASEPGFQPIHDPVGNTDASTYSSAERDYPNWEAGSTGTPSGKSDIGNVYVFPYRDGDDDLNAAFAWDRAGDTGTGRYYVELNQKKDQGLVPVRTIGDRRITIGINGSDTLECQRIESWSGSAWANATSCSSIPVKVNTGSITDYFNSPNDNPAGTLGQNTFVELSVNLTDFGATACPVTGFQSLSLRSQEGGQNGDTSSLKDRATGNVNIPSDCGSLVIQKKVNGVLGAAGAGAVFQVSPDPTTGTGSTIVTTGNDGTVTITGAKPAGNYSVRELAPPAGLLLPNPDTQSNIVVPKGAAGTVTFNDVYGTGAWTKGYEGANPPDTGATFHVVRTKKWSYDTDPAGGFAAPSLVNIADDNAFDVTDNDSVAGAGEKADTNAAMGKIGVSGLQGGTWCVTETAAPTGWSKDADTECFTVGPTDSNADANPSLDPTGNPPTFTDPLKPVTLQVNKTESSDGVAGSTANLAGVTFNLYADNNGVKGALVGTDVTGAGGHASFSGLDWQKAYWLEEVAKDGYRIGLDPNPKKVSFTSADGGTTVSIAVDNPRTEWSIQLDKVDGTTQSPLTGGTFQLWRESNGTPGLQTIGTADTKLGVDQSLSGGSLTFDKASYDIPWGYTYYVLESAAPTGYGKMAPNPIVVDATDKPTADKKTLVFQATDPQVPSTLKVIKHDKQTNAVVDGAQFDLHKEINGVDTVVGHCGPTTGGNPCSVSNLTFGTYWWVETDAPTGYTKDTTPSDSITIDADNAGSADLTVTVIKDPQIPAHIKVIKRDADTGALLDGAKFTLYADTNGNHAYDEGVDQAIGGEHGTTDGVYTWTEDLVWGDYFVKETTKPDLYDFDTTQVQKIVIERKDAGNTLSVTFNDPQVRRSITVDKVWFINGVKYTGGVARQGFTATLGLTGGDTSSVDWGKAHGGYLLGETGKVTETVDVPSNCLPVNARVTEKNGDPIDVTLTSAGYLATVPQLSNHYTVTNTVTCSTKITLDKSVVYGGASASSWNLTADGPGSDDVTGTSGVSKTVPAAQSYALSEANGTAAPAGTDLSVYQQQGDWSCATDGANSVPVDVVNGAVTPTLDTAAITCTVKNTTAKLTLVKHVSNTHGGDAAASAWDLKATPAAGGLSSKTVDGSETGVTVEVKPGASYSLTESGTPDGYHLQGIVCTGGTQDGNAVSVAAGSTAVCTFTNVDEQPGWTVSKTSTPETNPLLPGKTILYTLTVKHTSGGIVPKNVVVEDDLSDVNLDATVLGSPNAPAGTTANVVGDKLTWTIPVLDATKTLTFTVTVKDGAWDKTLVNKVKPVSDGGTCDETVGCTTTDTTPKLPKLTIDKVVVNGLGGVATKDWWRLTADRVGGAVPATKSSLAGNGGDSALVAAGSYTLAEADAPDDGHATSDYSASSWSCKETGTDTVVPAPGSIVALTYGDDVTCSITNTQIAHWKVTKSADKADGGTYKPGESIVYSITVTHTSGINPTNVSVSDDLSSLTPYAGTITTDEPGNVVISGNTLTWAVGTVATTRTLTVTVPITDAAGSAGRTLKNFAWSPGSDNCPTLVSAGVDGDCNTVHYTPKWTLTKTSVPGDGVVQPKSSITYTLTVTNTSDAVVSGMTAYDDVSDLLGKVTPDLATNPPAGTTYDAANKRLVWAVPTITTKGGTATLVYTVTVKSDAWDTTLKNVATPKDNTGACPSPADCDTSHTTPKQPLLTLVKVVDNGISQPVAKTAWDLTATPAGGPAPHGLGGFGPTGVDPGTYSLAEQLVDQGVDGSKWSASGWSCVRTGTALPASLTSGNQLALVPNDDVTCTITNTRKGEWTVAKSSTTTEPFLPGGTITYTLKAVHTEGVSPTSVVLHDDLTQVMAHANSFTLGSPTSGSAVRTPAAPAEPASLDWTIPSLSGTQTLTFTVKADDDAWDTHFVNAVTSSGSQNCPDSEHVATECKTDDETPAKPQLTLVKRVTDPQETGDEAAPADWTVSATDVQDSENAVSGNGDPSDEGGVSDEQVLPGTFQLAESGGPSGYAFKGWSCVDNTSEGGSLGQAFDGETNKVTLAPDDDVTCTVTNEAVPGTFKVEKSSDPVDGSTVAPGQTVTYTVTATHLAGVSPRNVLVTDDLSDVLDDATDFTVVSSPAGTTVVNPSAENGQKLSWTIAKLDTTATIVYSVKVGATAFGVSLRNVVVAPASSNCPTATSTNPECRTVHPTAKWTLEKSSDPVTGSDVDPGEKITYTLKAVNVSDAPVTGMTVTDDLSDVLDDATLDAVPAGATLSGTKLLWSVPTLAARGDSATLSYTVTVEEGSSLATLHNVATPDQPSGSCVAVGACETTHKTPEILGEEAEVPPARTPPVIRGVDNGLPSTGGPGEVWIWSGAGLLLAGCGLVMASRRRRDEA